LKTGPGIYLTLQTPKPPSALLLRQNGITGISTGNEIQILNFMKNKIFLKFVKKAYPDVFFT